MKTQKIEKEQPFVDDRGYLHTDTGDPWHAYAPRIFWTEKARHLFRAALDAGILEPSEGDLYLQRAEGITKAQLAYWCKRASTYLGLDKGRMQESNQPRTCWPPFDQFFGTTPSAPLRAALHNIEESTAPEEYTAEIDAFFESLNAEPTPGR